VLPFVDMSELKDQEYFADGMAEEVIDLLAKVPGVRVIGRTSSFQFKASSPSINESTNETTLWRTSDNWVGIVLSRRYFRNQATHRGCAISAYPASAVRNGVSTTLRNRATRRIDL
jgi:hypothetical protein